MNTITLKRIFGKFTLTKTYFIDGSYTKSFGCVTDEEGNIHEVSGPGSANFEIDLHKDIEDEVRFYQDFKKYKDKK